LFGLTAIVAVAMGALAFVLTKSHSTQGVKT
jgi:hypothetical protein